MSSLDLSMVELFKAELETNSRVLEKGLVIAEKEQSKSTIEPLMRAAHSIKGAARIVGLPAAVTLSHAMEEVLSKALKQELILKENHIEYLLRGTDIFIRLSEIDVAAIESALEKMEPNIAELSGILEMSLVETTPAESISELEVVEQTECVVTIQSEVASAPIQATTEAVSKPNEDKESSSQSYVRIASDNLDRILGLAGEVHIRSKNSNKYLRAILATKKELQTLLNKINRIQALTLHSSDTSLKLLVDEFLQIAEGISEQSDELVDSYDYFSRKLVHASGKLYSEAIKSRMRPFSDGTQGFPRMVRDLSKQLNKNVRLEIVGESTLVDRDILDRIEAPLSHLVTNAVYHGIEDGNTRTAGAKSAEGVVKMVAYHSGGMLHIAVSDDGGGIDIEAIKKKVVERGYTTAELVSKMTNNELTDFLFLPGFSTVSSANIISGRGVGLDIVQSMVHKIGGNVRVATQLGVGTEFQLQLPITLSLIRSLLVEISGELYAFPLARIDTIQKIQSYQISSTENRQYYVNGEERIGLMLLSQILGLSNKSESKEYSIVFISDKFSKYGVVVDKFMGERDLVVQQLDQRLGKIRDISSGSILEDGRAVLILEIDDLVRSIDEMLNSSRPSPIIALESRHQREVLTILVVDDSITVREVERKLLESKGYKVETAVDGIDGLNKLLEGSFDLLITDVDMPRMNGIELVKKVRVDSVLKNLPVMIVSYKDREEDRIAGLNAGANYYLTKGSFHDEGLINAVRDLIGEVEE